MGVGRQTAAFVLLAIVHAPFAATAAETDAGERRIIRVVGVASASATPDRAEIDLGVLTQGANADQAASANAKRVDGVLAAVRKVLDSAAELKTIGYSVTPLYGEAKPGRSSAISGYSAQNVIRVTTSDLSRVSSIIDAAMAAGANDIRGLQFSIANEQDVRARALRDAVNHAKAEAEVIAAALGVKVLRVRGAEAAGEPPIVRPMMIGAAMARGGPVATPVEPGTIEVHASVTVTFEIGE
jgi:uncharacterized protein YggE